MSNLNIEKLQFFTSNNGYDIHKIFVKKSKCFMVELMSRNTVDFILLYIPTKFAFPLPSNILTFPVEEFQHRESRCDDINEYSHASETLIESSYSDMESITALPTDKRNKLPMSKHLDEAYKKNIIVNDIQGSDNVIIQNIYRQLRRLKYCIRGMTHKLAVINAPYIGVLNSNYDISMYCCETLKRKKEQRLYIIVDVKMFYDRIDTIEQECSHLFNGIYTVLDNNQKLHSKNIKYIMDQRDNILQKSTDLHTNKMQYMQYIDKYVNLLDELNSYEKTKTYDLKQLNSVPYDPNDLRHDMKRTHQKKKLEKEIREIHKTRNDITKTIKDLKLKMGNLSLSIDTILFDNIVMIDKVFKNFEELGKLEKLNDP